MKTSDTDPIRLDFIESKECPALNRLGMTLAPGKKVQTAAYDGWNRDLGKDLGRLKYHYRVETLVSLVEYEELGFLGINDFPDKCESQGIELVQFPLKDGCTPASFEEFAGLIVQIKDRLNNGKTVAVHCRGGLGRTGLTAACVIVAVSGGKIDGSRAIEMVRIARPGTVETKEQEQFVVDLADRLRTG